MLSSDAIEAALHIAGLEPAAVVLKRLGTPTTIDIRIDAGHPFYPASMIKTPLALAAYSAVENGDMHLDDRIECTQANMTINDKPSPLVPGHRSTVRELIELMITISDNVATNMFFDVLGRERATAIVQKKYGLAETAFYRKLSGSEPLIDDPGWVSKKRNTHPASDAARLFELIATDAVPYAHALRETLGRQQFNDKLSLGLRGGDRFYHKTGDTGEVTHDGGVLDTAEGASYVIVVYTGLESSDSNNRRFAPLMKALRPLM
jgi:beta-lactamase class A